MVCRFGVNRRLVIPVILVPTPPRYLALPRVSTWLPTEADFPQTSQALDMVHPKNLSNHNNLAVFLARTNLIVWWLVGTTSPFSCVLRGLRSISVYRPLAMSKIRDKAPIAQKSLGNYTVTQSSGPVRTSVNYSQWFWANRCPLSPRFLFALIFSVSHTSQAA